MTTVVRPVSKTAVSLALNAINKRKEFTHARKEKQKIQGTTRSTEKAG